MFVVPLDPPPKPPLLPGRDKVKLTQDRQKADLLDKNSIGGDLIRAYVVASLAFFGFGSAIDLLILFGFGSTISFSAFFGLSTTPNPISLGL
jgi:hypothetical protein